MDATYSSSWSDGTSTFYPLSALLDFFFFHQRICYQGTTNLRKSFMNFWSPLRSPRELGNHRPRPEPSMIQEEESSDRRVASQDVSSGLLSREDVEMVMGRLGLCCSLASDGGISETCGVREISRVFEEKLSLEDVEGAFMVFDGNRDGFIDAGELQRVLCSLGFKEGKEIDNCEKMIVAFDRNGDGKMDFEEFVMFLENRSYYS